MSERPTLWNRIDYLSSLFARAIALGGFLVVATTWATGQVSEFFRPIVRTGAILVSYETNPDIRNGPFPQAGVLLERGITAGEGRVEFGVRFSTPPAVTTGLTHLDVLDGTPLRLTFEVNSIDESGFNYSFLTWADTRMVSATVNWMAVGS